MKCPRDDSELVKTKQFMNKEEYECLKCGMKVILEENLAFEDKEVSINLHPLEKRLLTDLLSMPISEIQKVSDLQEVEIKRAMQWLNKKLSPNKYGDINKFTKEVAQKELHKIVKEIFGEKGSVRGSIFKDVPFNTMQCDCDDDCALMLISKQNNDKNCACCGGYFK